MPPDRAQQTARRKAIYLELHPETAHGANATGPSGQFGHTAAPSFTEATSKAIGAPERTVRRAAERGEKIIDAAMDIVRGTELDTGTYLDKLKKLSPSEHIRRFAKLIDYCRGRLRAPPALPRRRGGRP